MSLDCGLAGLLHPNQVLTADQAAAWVQRLIDHFTGLVTTIPVRTLDQHEVPEHIALAERLLEHAGVLEQLLCRISCVLPGHVVENVVAMIVASHHQMSLLEAPVPHSIESPIIISMTNHLAAVMSRLDATDGWVHSDEYVRVRRGVDDSIAEMRASHMSFVAWYQDGADEGDQTDGQATWHTFLPSLYSEQSSARLSWPDADRMVLTTNFRPLMLPDALPYTHPDLYACRNSPPLSSASSCSSGSSTAYSQPSPASRKGKERALPQYTRSSSSGASEWSTSAEVEFPRRLPSPIGLSSSPEPPDGKEAGPSTLKRGRTDTQGRPSKKRRVSLTLYGVYGDSSKSEDRIAVDKRVRTFVGRSIPLTGNFSPSILPSPSRSLSPEPAVSSTSRHVSPVQAPSLPSVDLMPSPRSATSTDTYDSHDTEIRDYAYEPSTASTSGDEDIDASQEASSYITTSDVSLTYALDGSPVATETDSGATQKFDTLERARAPSRRRRCFAGLLQTVKYMIFGRR